MPAEYGLAEVLAGSVEALQRLVGDSEAPDDFADLGDLGPRPSRWKHSRVVMQEQVTLASAILLRLSPIGQAIASPIDRYRWVPYREGRVNRKLSVIIAILATTVAMMVATSTADAAVKWPARCTTFKCVNAHLNAMHATDLTQYTRLANLAWVNQCLKSAIPLTQYGGYIADDGAGGVFDTTAFDRTGSGDLVDEWVPVIDPGTCGLGGVAARTATSSNGHTFSVAPAPPSGHALTKQK